MAKYSVWTYIMAGTSDDIVEGVADTEKRYNDFSKRLAMKDAKKATSGLSAQDKMLFNELKEIKDRVDRYQERIPKLQADLQAQQKIVEQKKYEFQQLQMNNELNSGEQRRREMELNKLEDDLERLKQDFRSSQVFLSIYQKDLEKNLIFVANPHKSQGLVNWYAPSDSIQSQRVEVLQGVGASNITPIRMNREGKMSKFAFLPALTGLLTGKGEQENIDFCLYQLEQAEKKGELPERIVLNGYSRGACACIELATKIFDLYGDKIKIAINIDDPVPGPGRHKKSKMVIPTNVDSVVITYAAQENSPILRPLDLLELHFDPSKTTVTAIPFLMSHTGVSTSVQQNIININSSMLSAIANQPKPVAIGDSDIHDTSKDPINSARNNCVLWMASDPTKNTNLSGPMKQFHTDLQSAVSGKVNLQSINGKEREVVASAVACIPDTDAKSRKMKLDVIFAASKKAMSKSNLSEAELTSWENNCGKSGKFLKESLNQTIKDLKEKVAGKILLNKKKDGTLNAHDQHRLAVVTYLMNSLAMLADQIDKNPGDYKQIYRTLECIKAYVESERGNLAGKGLNLFRPFDRSGGTTYKLIMSALNAPMNLHQPTMAPSMRMR